MSEKKNSEAGKRYTSGNDRRLLTSGSPFAVREAFVRLRTGMMFCMTADGEEPCRVFGITSAKPAEGKSLIAVNTALSFAMLQKRTLLIDGDLRKPTLRRLWDIRQKTGLSDFLVGAAPLRLTALKDVPLTVIPSGSIPPNPSEILSSELMRQFIESCKEKYDYIIIDTPPVGTVADAQIASVLVDGFVVVARSGSTSRDELNDALGLIEAVGGNICGVVLNDVSRKSLKYNSRYNGGYSYRYRYGGRYGYERNREERKAYANELQLNHYRSDQ